MQGSAHEPFRLARCAVALCLAAALCSCSAFGRGESASKNNVSQYGIDLVLRDLDGRMVPFSDFSGRVVLVDLFTTWCLPCLREIPLYLALQQRYRERGFTMVGVAMDLEGARTTVPYRDFYHIDYPLLIANDDLRAGRTPFGPPNTIPLVFLLDPDGKIVKAFGGFVQMETLESEIVKLLRR